MLKTCVLLAFTTLLAVAFAGEAQRAQGQSPSATPAAPVIRLGERLFRDERFSTPRGDLPASCSHCHLLDEDPQGLRAFADFFNRSWVSYRPRDPRRLGLRNAPTLLDVAAMPRLHFDGEFGSLEDLVIGTFVGRPMGWLPGEEQEGIAHARAMVLHDGKGVNQKTDGGEVAYRVQFKEAFGIELDRLNAEQTMRYIAKAVAAYCRTLVSRKDSPYDQFIALNRLDARPNADESGSAFGARLLAQLTRLETSGALKLTQAFDRVALAGLKIFFNAERGNCATCHAPPLFTDQAFHNLGISQREYDRAHGEGQFATLIIPDAARAQRPSVPLRETPSPAKPGEADLGHWNFVDLKSSPQRRAGESDDRFLQRMIATFKTPTLRNLQYTQPYFHDGSINTLEDVLAEMLRLSDMMRAGQVREGDEELAKIKFTAAEIPLLVAFLNTLNEDLKRLAQNKR